MEQQVNKELFKELYLINVNENVEKKKTGGVELSYLSWTYAIKEISSRVDDFNYDILPYTYDENLGYMVYTQVTANGVAKKMWLPVMDGANKAMKNHPYKYYVKNYKNPDQPIEKTVEAASMMDINKAYMRCLVKNIGMFGLGLYIYAGEDLPESFDEEPTKSQQEVITSITESQFKELCTQYGQISMNQYLHKKGYTKVSQMTYEEYLQVKNEGLDNV